MIAECVQIMDCIKRFESADLLTLTADLSRDLTNRDPQYIQQVLDAASRSALPRLSLLENYVYSNP
jgi:hypothetical protein